MRFQDIATDAASHLLWHLVRAGLVLLAAVIFAGVTIYQLTIAGETALDAQVGALQSHLYVAAAYAALTLIALAVLWASRHPRRLKSHTAPAVSANRETQLVMLVEAVMLGYSLARARTDQVRQTD